MQRWLWPLALCLWTSAAWSEKPVAPEAVVGTTRVTAEEVVQLLQAKPGIVVIDARRWEEFTKGHIEGSISLVDTDVDAHNLETHVPDRSTPVLFYCNGERCLRSAQASSKAVAAGYQQVYWFRGGWREWLDKGLPVAH